MGFSYFKRYRMEHDLRRCLPAPPSPPAGYRFVPWDPSLVDIHGEVKYRSFRWEIDSGVFSCLGEFEGCRQLMREISQREGFLPSTTWLVQHECPRTRHIEYCGTIQGIQTGRSVGNIQNVGTTPEHRNRGIGKALVLKSLCGFQMAGITKVFLEVTAQNSVAVQLYRQIGFRHVKTVYKAVEIAYS